MSVIETSIKALKREKFGKSSGKNIVKSGFIPAVIYAKNKETIHIIVPQKEMTKIYHSGFLTSTVIDLEFEGQIHKVLVKEIQTHPVKDHIIHIDFIFILENQKTYIPILFENKARAIGIKRGGFFNQIHRKLQCVCDNYKTIPQQVSVNVEDMHIGSKLRAKYVVLPEGCKLGIDENTIIASITGRGGKSKEGLENSSEA